MNPLNTAPRNALQPGYQLLWYNIRSILGQGAFGITYLAQDVNLKRLVAVKEFLPSQYAMRDGNEMVRPVSDDVEEKFMWGLRRFIDEARILDQFEHTNIVRIMNIFEANNTAYLVMRYEQGVSLKEILIRQKFLDEADLLNILYPVLDGLEKIHEEGFIHRDIKPANIFVRTDGTPVLLDFGSARQSLLKETHTLTSLVSPGYAPIEQYVSKSDKQGPWSDIYGMAATLYRAVTGMPPNDAVTRGEALTGSQEDTLIKCRELADKRYSDQFIAAIQHGLEFLTRDRPQTVQEWIPEFPELHAPAGMGTTIPGRTSREVVSIVRESLTLTATQVNEDISIPDFWKNEQAPTSIEMAHKEGFHRGLKLALGVLTLVICGLFIGNYQKIKDVVSPGFVPQQVISTAPETLGTDGRSVEEISSIGSPLETPVAPGIQTDLQNDPLNPDSSSEMGAFPELIMIDQPPETINNGDTVVEETVSGVGVITESTQQISIAPGKTELDDIPLAKTIPVSPGSTEDNGIVYYEDERVTEIKEQAEKRPVIVIKNTSPPPAQKKPVKTAQNTSTIKREEIDPKVLDNKNRVAKESGVTIEEYHVPPKPKSPDDDLVVRFRNWVNFLVTQGQNGKNAKTNDQLSEKDKNGKPAKGPNL